MGQKNVSIPGLESPIYINKDSFTTLVVENPTLYARVCQSLISNKGIEAIEPYSLWDDEGNELSSREQFLFVDPFHLPWEAKNLSNHLYDNLLESINDSEEIRLFISELDSKMRTAILTQTFQFNAAYGFTIEWDMKKFLKAFGFHATTSTESTLLDNVIDFLCYASDMGFQGVLVFINLRSFFSEKDYQTLVTQLLFLRIQAIFLESRPDWELLPKEFKVVVDQDFLEYHSAIQSEFLSSGREEFAPMVLEQWNSDW